MKCPECERNAQKSKLNMPQGWTSTLMGGSRNFYDEDGNHHYHEVNSTRGQAVCSNGHRLTVTQSTKCLAPECDYGHPQTMELQS